MSLLNFSLRKKSKTSYAHEDTPFSGFILEENSVHDGQEALLHCFIKGLLIFAASFGCISGVLSEFDIAYNYVAVLLIILLSSMALSMIHLKKWLFNIGYPVFFVLFTSSLIRYRLLANSGFQALLNIVNEDYSSHFLMLFTRESTETITDRYLTITAAAVFLGIFLAILINVGIFNDMYFCTTFNLTFWPLQLGIYIGKYPSAISMGMLFFSYFAIYFLKHSGHYHFIYPGKKREYTKTYNRKGKQYVFYKSNARNMAQLCLFALVISLFFSAFGSASAPRSETEASISGSMKKAVDPYVKIFVQNGLAGFFNRYHATGGISNGRLGGISSVRPDYQTDLLVTFVPYAYETVYLKAFVGAEYTSTAWKEPGSMTTGYQYPALTDPDTYIQDTTAQEGQSPDRQMTAYSNYHNYCAYTESETLNAMMEEGAVPSMKGTMIIQNVDASGSHLYLPYYSSPLSEHAAVSNENNIKGVLLQDTSMMLDYIPYSPSQTDLDEKNSNTFSSYRNEEQNTYFSLYKTEVYNNYLQIPDEILHQLIDYQKEIGTGDTITEQISLIRQFLTAGYEYDMAPGTTPRDEDFVTYFLGTQKKGYCAHFASAATLLFRSYGIPARYVEGYVVTQTAISERAQTAAYEYEDFFEGKNVLGSPNVVEVEVTDGDAHAWVEVFIDGFGWMPVEVTPPSQDDEETTYGDFLSALSGLFGGGENAPQGGEEGGTPEYNDIFSSLQFQNSPVIGVFLGLLAAGLMVPLLILVFRKVKAYIRRRRAYHKGMYDVCIAYEYQKLHRLLSKKYPDALLILPEDVGILLKQVIAGQDNTIDEMIALTEKSCFSENQISKETAHMLMAFYKSTTHAVCGSGGKQYRLH